MVIPMPLCRTLSSVARTAPSAVPLVTSIATFALAPISPVLLDAQIRVDPEPVFEIGGSLDDPEDQLFRVADAVRLPDGRIAVANAGSNEIRIYDTRGGLETSFGREGEGPGEFRRIVSLHVLSPDSLAIFDRAQQRISIFSAGGELVDDVPVPQGDAGNSRDVIRLADGRWVSVHERLPEDVDGLWRKTARLVLRTRGLDPIRPLAELPAELWVTWTVDGRGMTRGAPFWPLLTLDAIGSCVVAGVGDEAGVRILPASGEPRRLDLELDRRPVTRAVFDRWVEDLASDIPEEQRGLVDRMMSGIPRPDSLPVVQNVVADPEGLLWIQRYEPPVGSSSRWEVLDLEGSLVASVELPGAYRVTDVGSDYILGLRSGPLDMEVLAMHAIEREGEAPPSTPSACRPSPTGSIFPAPGGQAASRSSAARSPVR